MRVFVGLPLEAKVRNELGVHAERLQNQLHSAKGSWVRPENYHMTLLFLGEITERELPGYISSVKTALKGQNKFMISFAGFSAFPSIKNVKVLYCYPDEGSGSCRELYNKIEASLPERFSSSSKFRSHLTLARFHRQRPAIPAEVWQRKLLLSYIADKCFFYQSVLSSQKVAKGAQNGPVYRELAAIKFDGDKK